LEVAREELYRRIASRFICKAHQHIYNIHSSPPQRAGICDLDGSELYQRSDDQGTTIQQRLDIFFAQTIHLLDYYGAQENILKIDGGQAVENVHRAIIAGLSKLALGRGIGRRREIVGNVNGPL
jgi:adenylate kinase